MALQTQASEALGPGFPHKAVVQSGGTGPAGRTHVPARLRMSSGDMEYGFVPSVALCGPLNVFLVVSIRAPTHKGGCPSGWVGAAGQAPAHGWRGPRAWWGDEVQPFRPFLVYTDSHIC